MHLETRRSGRHATVVVTGRSDERAGSVLFAELTRLLEAGVTVVLVDTRAVPGVHPSVPAACARFHDLVRRLGGDLALDPPSQPWVHPSVPAPRHLGQPEPGHPRSGASHWFG